MLVHNRTADSDSQHDDWMGLHEAMNSKLPNRQHLALSINYACACWSGALFCLHATCSVDGTQPLRDPTHAGLPQLRTLGDQQSTIASLVSKLSKNGKCLRRMA